mmetsp:Transcript_50134/g.95760  ORF Transcript_50134/g.95760 Transcript_50134/m.95760 type:complete len:287 (-) Transcript_50134:168-1028(-)
MLGKCVPSKMRRLPCTRHLAVGVAVGRQGGDSGGVLLRSQQFHIHARASLRRGRRARRLTPSSPTPYCLRALHLLRALVRSNCCLHARRCTGKLGKLAPGKVRQEVRLDACHIGMPAQNRQCPLRQNVHVRVQQVRMDAHLGVALENCAANAQLFLRRRLGAEHQPLLLAIQPNEVLRRFELARLRIGGLLARCQQDGGERVASTVRAGQQGRRHVADQISAHNQDIVAGEAWRDDTQRRGGATVLRHRHHLYLHPSGVTLHEFAYTFTNVVASGNHNCLTESSAS